MSVPAWPVFICYRQSDGRQTAERLFALLHGVRIPAAHSEAPAEDAPALDVYFDQAAPGVGDWTTVHEPYLKRARAFLVVCTPGAKLVEGPQDWVHREINWWLENRLEPPILIDALGEGERYVPAAVAEKWPKAQRIPVVAAEWARLDEEERRAIEQRTRSRIVGGITQSGQNIYRRELEQEQARTRELTHALVVQTTLSRRLKYAFLAITLLFVLAVAAAAYGLWQRRVSEERRISALSGQLGAISQLMVDRSTFQWERAALLAVEGLRRRPNFELVDVAQRLTVLLLKPNRTLSRPATIDSFALSAEGTLLATVERAGDKSVIEVTAVPDGKVRARTTMTLSQAIFSPTLKFDPTGETLVFAGATDAFAWRWGTPEPPRKLAGLGQRKIVASRDGRWLAGLGGDGVHLFDLRRQHHDRVIPAGESPWMHSVVFSAVEPDTLFLARDDEPGYVSILDVRSGRVTRRIFVTRTSTEVDLNTPLYDFASGAGRLVERGVGVGDMFATSAGHLIVSEDRFVVRPSDDWHLHVWNVRGEPQRVRTIVRPRRTEWKISREGAHAAGGDDKGEVAVYDLASGEAVAARKFAQAIRQLDISARGDVVAVASAGDTAVVWEWHSNEIIGRGAAESEVRDIKLAGTHLWALTYHGGLDAWDLPDNPSRDRAWFRGSVSGLAEARYADAAIVWTDMGELMLWRPSSGHVIARTHPGGDIGSARLSDDGRIAAVLADFSVHVFVDGAQTQRIALPSEYEETWNDRGDRKRWIRHDGPPGMSATEQVPIVDFTGSADKDRRNTVARIVYWSAAAPRGWRRDQSYSSGHGVLGSSLALRADGNEFAVSILDWIIRYDTRSGRAISRVALGYTMTRHPVEPRGVLESARVQGLTYGPGNTLWVVTTDGDVWQWSKATLRRHGQWDVAGITDRGVFVHAKDGDGLMVLGSPPTTKPLKVAGHATTIAPGGSRIASVTYTAKPAVQVYGGHNPAQFTFTVSDATGGSSAWTKRHVAARLSVSKFSADGSLVAIGDEGGTVRVWRVEDGHELLRLSRPGSITRLAFTNDRSALLVASEHDANTLYIVLLNGTDLIERLCSRVMRDLTAFEWNEYLGDEPYRPSCSGTTPANHGPTASPPPAR